MIFICPCVSIDKNNTVERRARTLNISVEVCPLKSTDIRAENTVANSFTNYKLCKTSISQSQTKIVNVIG